jgi:hypothetical protein
MNDVKIPAGRKAWIVSADVVAFYPSIPLEEAKRALATFYFRVICPDLQRNGYFPNGNEATRVQQSYKDMAEVALFPPVMTYLPHIFVQKRGLPMGAAGSPDVANIYGIEAEMKFMGPTVRKDPRCLFYGRYLDDIFTIILAETPAEALRVVRPFTLGSVNLLWEPPALTANFLDLHLEIKGEGIYHEPFVKAASHRERIPWDSGHPLDVCQEHGIFQTF